MYNLFWVDLEVISRQLYSYDECRYVLEAKGTNNWFVCSYKMLNNRHPSWSMCLS